jgi:hypothetical protein
MEAPVCVNWQHYLQQLVKTVEPLSSADSDLLQPLLLSFTQQQVLKNEVQDTAIETNLNGLVSLLPAIQATPNGSAKRKFILSIANKLLSEAQDGNIWLRFNMMLSALPNNFPEDSYHALWHGVKSGLLTFGDEDDELSLHKAIHLTQQALTAEHNKRLLTWFISDQAIARRTALLRGMHFGYLSVGKAKDQLCWQHFRDMVSNGLSQIPRYLGTHYHKQAMQGLSRTMQGLEDMLVITTLPKSGVPVQQPSALVSLQTLMNGYQQQLGQLTATYTSAWFKNTDRRPQLKQLQQTLSQQQFADRNAYYQAMVQALLTTQQSIVDSDVGKNRNTKGHSRLYDVCATMLRQVVSGYLTDDADDLPAKDERAAWVSQQMQQLQVHHQQKLVQYQTLFKLKPGGDHQALRYLTDVMTGLNKGGG